MCVCLIQFLSPNFILFQFHSLYVCRCFSLSCCFSLSHTVSFSCFSVYDPVYLFVYMCVSSFVTLCVGASHCVDICIFVCVYFCGYLYLSSHHTYSLTHVNTQAYLLAIRKTKYFGTLYLFKKKCSKMETTKYEWELLSLSFCLFESQD